VAKKTIEKEAEEGTAINPIFGKRKRKLRGDSSMCLFAGSWFSGNILFVPFDKGI